jgi:heat shock protein HslJ
MRSLDGHYGKMLTFISLVLLLGCASAEKNGWVKLKVSDESRKPAQMIEGVVKHLPIEGGLFVIQSADGKQYHPIHLPKTFQSDGLQVQANIQILEDVMSVGMVGPVIDLLEIRKLPDEREANVSLFVSTWRLIDLAGQGVVEGPSATIHFVGNDEVAGSGSCNRFHGKVTIDNAQLKFGHLASTRKYCINEKVMQQESAYLSALESAERYEIKGQVLYIYAFNLLQPLRFVVLNE